MLIRPLQTKDEPVVRALIQGILDQEFSVEKAAYPATDLDALTLHYAGPRDTFLVAVENGQVVGTVAVKEDDPKTALLRRLFVDRTHRGKRYGSQLVDQALVFCRQKGYKRAAFRGGAGMTQALTLMRRKGFTEKERLRFAGTEMIHFHRSL